MQRIGFATLAFAFAALIGPPASAEDWPQFRGSNRDAISQETGLLRSWPEGGPKVLWSKEMSEGYSAAAIFDNHVYINDYDRKSKEWFVRCLSLDKGEELWQYRVKKRIRPNHGITRTVPSVDDKYIFSLDPKCTLHCVDRRTGTAIWTKNLVREYETTIPAWYAGQCPLIDGDRVIVAPGGKAMLVAFDKATGSPVWETPNPDGRAMAHASVMPAVIGGVKQLVYVTLEGPIGVAADDGRLLWSHPLKFNLAVPVSPLVMPDGIVFLTSCYEADTVMIQVRRDGDKFVVEQKFMLPPTEWNSETHTPIFYKNHMFAVGKKKRGLFTCLDLEGNQVWTSRGHASFGLGSCHDRLSLCRCLYHGLGLCLSEKGRKA